MIRFSKREDDAVILIGELVKQFGKRVVSLSEVAKKHNISVLFLRNIAADLRKADLIEAVEGKNGGYKLKKAPDQMQLGEIISAVSKQSIFSCCQNTKDGKCSANACPHGFSLRRAHNTFLETLVKKTLDTL